MLWILALVLGFIGVQRFADEAAGAGGEGAGEASAATAATAVSDTAGTGGQAAEGGAGAEAAANAVAAGWEAEALPANHPALGSGAKTWGDADRMYRESSREAREARGQVTNLQAAVQNLLLEQAQRAFSGGQQQQQQQQQQQATASPANNWFGFGSQQAYTAAYQADPQGTLSKVFEWQLENNPRVSGILERLSQRTGQAMVAPLQQHMATQSRMAEAQALVARYPEFQQGTPTFEAIRRAADAAPWVAQFGQMLPVDVVYKALHYDLLRQQGKASDAKMNAQRATAGTARVGAGGVSAPAGSFEAEIRAAAEVCARQTGQAVSEDQIQEQLAMARRMGILRDKKG